MRFMRNNRHFHTQNAWMVSFWKSSHNFHLRCPFWSHNHILESSQRFNTRFTRKNRHLRTRNAWIVSFWKKNHIFCLRCLFWAHYHISKGSQWFRMRFVWTNRICLHGMFVLSVFVKISITFAYFVRFGPITTFRKAHNNSNEVRLEEQALA